MQRRLGLINQHQAFRLESYELTHQLAAYRARRTAYQNDFAGQGPVQVVRLQLDRRPLKQILYAHFPHLAKAELTVHPVFGRRYV